MAAMTDASAAREPRPAPPTDEISLRDLYLVLRRSLVWIAVAALVAGVAAYLILGGRPASYVAEATAVVARVPIEVGLGTGLRFRPEVDITFDTYQTLAYSRGVLEAVLPMHEAGDLSRLRGALSLERVAGSANQASGLLAVVHRVASADPERAAAAASAWAAATVATARALLLENLDAVETITGQGLTTARADLLAAETEVETFRARSGIESLRTSLGTAQFGVVGTLELAIAGLVEAQRANRLTFAQREAELASLVQRRDGGLAALEVVLFAARDVSLSVEGAIVSVEAQLAALRAERAVLAEELAQLLAERDSAVVALSEATVALARLERAAAGPREVVAALAAIEPTVAYVAQLAPSGARVLSEAVVPSAPESRSRGLVALLVAVAVAFAGVVLALLAEAVRDPRSARR